MKTIRQGDVLFVPAQGEMSASNPRKDGIIQEGEATGHHHRVEVLEDAEVFRPEFGDAVVKVGPNGVSIVHEEHATVTLEPNTTYIAHIAREFDYLGQFARQVQD